MKQAMVRVVEAAKETTTVGLDPQAEEMVKVITDQLLAQMK